MDGSFLASSRGPPWLPAAAVDARRLAYWGQVFFFVVMIVSAIFGIISLFMWVLDHASGGGTIYLLVTAVVNFIILYIMKPTVFDHIDQGRFSEASDHMLIYGVLGIIFGIIPGIFLIIAFVRLQEVFQPQYQPYPPGQIQTTQPSEPAKVPSHPSPPQQPTPPPAAAPEKPKQPEMVKCKKCGVQYPAFMRTCPNCGEAR
ncbi:MAG: hypothetical protein H5T41_04080 [Methanomassiliicoccales archaeon]|nr:hypothetical protein [Methanomassiliicoccales archaeon]